MIACAATALAGCGSDGDGAPACLDFAPCGGELEGSWSVREVCFEDPDVLYAGLAPGGECDDTVMDVQTESRGARSYRADGELEIDLTLTTELSTFFFKDCIRASVGDPLYNINSNTCAGWEGSLSADERTVDTPGGTITTSTSASCVLRDDGCDCNITRVDEVARTTDYELDGDRVSEGEDSFPYCVDGDYLTLSIEVEGLTGNVVLQRE